MPVRMRFRTDSAHIAELKRQGKTFEAETFSGWPTREEWDATPAAEAGDTWRVRWAATIEQRAAGMTEGPIAGYAIGCIKCKDVHRWTTATNCATRKPYTFTYVDHDGVTQTVNSTRCDHEGTGSCWVWTGSAEANTLHASPSLHALIERGACGYHGHLENGILSDG